MATFWALLVGALQGLAALPKILDKITAWEVDERLNTLAKNSTATKTAFDALESAKTTEEKANAADLIASAWNNRGTN